ncbi:uncharacterized protein METZ01_LOCUS425467 [marine metagenome]|uniref:Uncharacterized protein n=1 Tax=marine metagenome TaxID=408172 RepID=A0A382XNP6_9ZZZZ
MGEEYFALCAELLQLVAVASKGLLICSYHFGVGFLLYIG